MTGEGYYLQERFSNLLRWERVKRREKMVVSVFCYSVLASIALLPARELLPAGLSPLVLLPALFFLLAPVFFLLRPWGRREPLRTVFLLDRALHLEERAITAWEILGRKEEKAAELLVLEEAGEKLKGVDPRALLKRRLTWHAFFAAPLLLLWLLLVWLDIGVPFGRSVEESQPLSVAQKLKEFAREMKEKAKLEQLTESLKIAHDLEEVAEKGLRGEMNERKLSEDLSRMANKIGDMGSLPEEESNMFFSVATKEGFLDLKAELETLKHTLNLPGSRRGESKLGPEILGILRALSRLRREIETGLAPIENLGRRELERFLDKLGKGVVTELDRHTLLEMRDFLNLLLKGVEGKETQGAAWEAAQAEEGRSSLPERVRGKGTLPGDEPGDGEQTPQTPSLFQPRAVTQLKGLLGEGKSGSLTFRGMAPGRESEISQEEIFTSYRRQAEEELASEGIPDSLKETIKRYFLSLGMTEDQREE